MIRKYQGYAYGIYISQNDKTYFCELVNENIKPAIPGKL